MRELAAAILTSGGEHILRQFQPVQRPQRAKLGIMGVPIGTFESMPIVSAASMAYSKYSSNSSSCREQYSNGGISIAVGLTSRRRPPTLTFPPSWSSKIAVSLGKNLDRRPGRSFLTVPVAVGH